VLEPDPVDQHHFPDPDTDRDWHSGPVDSDLDLYLFQPVLRIRIRDPEFGAFLTPRSGMEKNSDPGSRMNIPDNISESLETIFWVNKYFYAYPDPGSFRPWIQDPG
jgi:hypothetical protein